MILDLLWPQDDGPSQDLLPLPAPSRPRMLVPATSGRIAAGGVRALAADRSFRALARREVVAVGLRVGARGLLARRGLVSVGAAGITSYLSGILQEQVHVAVLVGPPRANRKPVLVLLRDDGTRAGYAKVAPDPLTRTLVDVEAAALTRLGDARFGVLNVPRLLHCGSWGGAGIVVQSPLRTRRARPAGSGLLVAALRELSGLAPGVAALADTDAWRRSVAALHRIDDERADALRNLARRVAERAGDVTVPVGAWHGDWTPWNVASLDGRVLAWDWERFATGVPAGYDALHYAVQQGVGVARRPLREVAERVVDDAPRLLAPYAVPPRAATAVACGYLVEVGARYLSDRQDATGSRVGRVEEWLIPAALRGCDLL